MIASPGLLISNEVLTSRTEFRRRGFQAKNPLGVDKSGCHMTVM
jgi:hypothetical protein